MKKVYLGLVVLGLFAVASIIGLIASAQVRSRIARDTPTVSPNIVISQFQAGGGTADDEFVELHNIGAAAVDLNGYRLVYRSASGSTDVGPFASWSAPTVIQPGQYYLVASSSYDGGVTADMT